MNVNSMAQSSYLAQMPSNSKVQSQSSASGMAPASGDSGSMMQQIGSQFMALLDTNQNGSIDKAEFSDAAKKLSQSTGSSASSNADNAFSAIDKNSDGSISASELTDILKQLSAKHKGHQMSTRIQNSSESQTPPPPPSEASNTKNLQSILMKNILSAYANTNLPGNGSTGISLKA